MSFELIDAQDRSLMDLTSADLAALRALTLPAVTRLLNTAKASASTCQAAARELAGKPGVAGELEKALLEATPPVVLTDGVDSRDLKPGQWRPVTAADFNIFSPQDLLESQGKPTTK